MDEGVVTSDLCNLSSAKLLSSKQISDKPKPLLVKHHSQQTNRLPHFLSLQDTTRHQRRIGRINLTVHCACSCAAILFPLASSYKLQQRKSAASLRFLLLPEWRHIRCLSRNNATFAAYRKHTYWVGLSFGQGLVKKTNFLGLVGSNVFCITCIT